MAFLTTALSFSLLMSSCAKKTDQTTVDSASATYATHSDTVANNPNPVADTGAKMNPATAPAMTDANIFAKLDEANSGEVSMAKVMLGKTKSADVKAFANLMVTDHTKLKNGGAALAKKLNITPMPPANDGTPKDVADMTEKLNAGSGTSLDKAYIDGIVEDHQKDIADLKEWSGIAKAPELKQMIVSAIPTVQKHLDHALMLQKKMSGMK